MAAISLSTLLVYVVVLPAMLFAAGMGVMWAYESLRTEPDQWLMGIAAIGLVAIVVWIVGFSGWVDTSS